MTRRNSAPAPEEKIRLRGLRQHNLKNLDLDLPLYRLIAISGVSGSGKSSLALHTLYAEGQRRYVETFSPYARQFLERMDRPQADVIDGIPPSIAIESATAVRSSRSTVGTITEVNDYLKHMYARLAIPFCPQCGEVIREDHPEGIVKELLTLAATTRLLVTFPYRPPLNEKWTQGLVAQGFLRIYADSKSLDLDALRQDDLDRLKEEILVVVDRLLVGRTAQERLLDSVATALHMGHGRMAAVVMPDQIKWFSSDLSCPSCGIAVPAPTPNLFSFNSPLGACPECRGFGRTIGVDLDLVIPDRRLSIGEGAIKPWGTERMEFADLMDFCRDQSIPDDIPFEDLPQDAQQKIIHGTKKYYGVMGFFEWLETKTYKMHVRVFLSRYRAYIPCKACGGSRYQALTRMYRLRGVTIDTLCSWSIDKCLEFFAPDWPELEHDPAADLLAKEITTRLRFLKGVGLEYLSLDRQSRTLSGGEVQRVHLTRALGSALVNVLYVLDEPSVGLHPRDQHRLMSQLRRLVELGNTVVVVEHDLEMIRSCDEVVDIGIGAGELGGEILFHGSPAGLSNCEQSLTGAYLSGRLSIPVLKKRRSPDWSRTLTVAGAREHNLKNITVAFPLGMLVGISGVSGSGKSTLMEKTLYHNWLRLQGKPCDSPGRIRALEGAEQFGEIIMVDQQPIGKSPRANLLTYTKLLDPLRKLFALTPAATARGYKPGHFSFNVAGGRCERCRGEGFERVEMQFLADVYLRCPVCGGRRFKDEVLEIRLHGLSIADILECTANELGASFADHPAVLRALQPIMDIGLDYLRLGQPLSTLSGGEAQRLKLLHYLKAGSGRKHSLFLLDEPTTGLHPHDLKKLVNVLQQLVDYGHSVMVVEHNLDLLKACDWIVDLGPEGGERGGCIVIAGTPEEVAAHPESHTGRHLQEKFAEMMVPLIRQEFTLPMATSPPALSVSGREISIRGAREHNLQLQEVHLPLRELIVITGLSGSGKSTLAFDVLFAEGQRRYLESLSAYVRQYFKILEKPDVDQILGLPPTVAIEQRSSQLGRRSTVATITEIYHFLRLLYAKLGKQHCPGCGRALSALTFDQILHLVGNDRARGDILLLAPLVRARKGVYRDLLLRLRKMGFQRARIDGAWVTLDKPPTLERHSEHNVDLVVYDSQIAGASSTLAEALRQALALGGGSFQLIHTATSDERIYSEKLYCSHCHKGFAPLDPRLFSFNSRHGACPNCQGIGSVNQANPEWVIGDPKMPMKEGLLKIFRQGPWRGLRGRRLEKQLVEKLTLDPEKSFEEQPPGVRHDMLYGRKKKIAGIIPLLEKLLQQDGTSKWLDQYFELVACPTCEGERLNAQARAVTVKEWSIGKLVQLDIDRFQKKLGSLPFTGAELPIAKPILTEIRDRLTFLRQVGLGYLELDRSGDTLSGGETQRIRLAAQLGSNLQGICYILDEPTIGLHPTDNRRLLDILEALKAKGNTVVVVEHDVETMKRADTLLELGPGAGHLGGQLTAQGTFNKVRRNPRTLTGAWFGPKPVREAQTLRDSYANVVGEHGWLKVFGARARNLKNVDVAIPLGSLTCVTGVSGSGKSTLLREVIYQGLLQHLGRIAAAPLESFNDMAGHESIKRVLEVDHNPIGRTPRSTPATYVGIWNEIRQLFASLPEARVRGFQPGRFSFNIKGGRCESCQGQGQVRVEMNFLPDVYVPCESCGGARFNQETLAIHYKQQSIADVLSMTIEEACAHFDAYPKIIQPLTVMVDLGLGYLTLGQPSPTLSGGEAQRIKLVSELGNARQKGFYILDEPTTGLHRADIQKLLRVLRALVANGHTVAVIEHNVDFIWASDYVLDLGPGAGRAGGQIVAAGTPEQVAERYKRSATGRALRKEGGRHL